MPLPIIDFGSFLAGTDKTTVARQIDRACRDNGFFYLKNHGLSRNTIDACFNAAAEFFALPEAKKAEIAIEKSPCHRGWYRLYEEILDPKATPKGDYKEGLKIGNDCGPDHPRVKAGLALHGPNQWPNIVGWQEIMQATYDECAHLSRQLMRAFALALALEEDFFDKWLHDPMATLSPIYYPPTTSQMGAGTHTDFGCLTLLIQKEIGGLSVFDQKKGWIEAPPIADCIIVNIGDMLARWTNETYRSTRHKVMNKSDKPRQSIAYFFDPDPDALIAALPSCIAQDQPVQYAPITGLDYLLEKINESFVHRSHQ